MECPSRGVTLNVHLMVTLARTRMGDPRRDLILDTGPDHPGLGMINALHRRDTTVPVIPRHTSHTNSNNSNNRFTLHQ